MFILDRRRVGRFHYLLISQYGPTSVVMTHDISDRDFTGCLIFVAPIESCCPFSYEKSLSYFLLQEMRLNLDHPKISGETTVQNAITEVAAMMGENVKFRRGYTMTASPHGVLSTYLHTSPKPGKGT